MKSRISCLAWGVAAIAGAAGQLVDASEARACGGCFHEPPPSNPTQTVSVITDHRMVFSISTTQTVLWDQVRYSGSPGSFAWVLPVKQGATIELSQDSWIASLDAATQTVIQGPSETCGGPASTEDVGSGGGGCGASSESGNGFSGGASSSSGGSSGGGVQNVTVVSQQVVGPYDAVTVRSSQGEALGTWLRENGYAIPQGIQLTIDAFANSGFDFIALKLAPGEGVQAMQPVRIISPGADLYLPLRMVAAGVGANVGLELFVLSEGRYHAQNFPDATIDFSKLAWDPTSDISNYSVLAQQALSANGGRGWLTEMAGPANLGQQTGPNPPLDQAYTTACSPQTLVPPTSCDAGAGTDGGGEAGDLDGGGDGEANGGDGGGSSSDGGGVTACQPQIIQCDDLSLAMTGIPTGDLWITRLRANLPAGALTADLILEATASQDQAPSFHATSQYTIANYNPCGKSSSSGAGASSSSNDLGCMCHTAKPSTRYADAIGVMLSVFVLGGVVRRRRHTP